MGIYYLTCTIGEQNYALSLNNLEIVVNAAALLPSPERTPNVLGLLNYQGRLIPIKDGRELFGHPPKELEPSDQFILCLTKKNPIGLRVDKVKDVVIIDEDQIAPFDSAPGLKGALHEGTLILDLED